MRLDYLCLLGQHNVIKIRERGVALRESYAILACSILDFIPSSAKVKYAYVNQFSELLRCYAVNRLHEVGSDSPAEFLCMGSPEKYEKKKSARNSP